MSKTVWPKEVPILEASDFCRGVRNGPNDTHCLAGHCMAARLPSSPYSVWYPTERVATALECAGRELGAMSHCGIMTMNDSRDNPLPLLARVWNRAMAKLGYVVGNPEAKYLKKKKR